MRPLRLHLSIHDVMPETLLEVRLLLEQIERLFPGCVVTLLVVPGRDWKKADLDQLQCWAADGHKLAGHGWRHRTESITTHYHRLHSFWISADVAEHLSASSGQIQKLLEKCFSWFAKHQLPNPDLYVPPAWALGRIPRHALGEYGFRWYELTSGYYDASTDRFCRVPLLGYEARHLRQKELLKLSNSINRLWAKCCGQLRIGLHPYDRFMFLRHDLHNDLERYAVAGMTATVSGVFSGHETAGI